MNIDPTTGLPQLPEGYFWEVKPYTYTKYSPVGIHSWEIPAGYEVVIMALYIEAKQGEKRWPWSKHEITCTETSATVTSKRLIDPEKYAAAEVEYQKYTESSSYWSGAYEHYFSKMHYDHLTPEIILEAATKLYTEWQDDLEAKRVAKAKREAPEALVGVYPPKALP